MNKMDRYLMIAKYTVCEELQDKEGNGEVSVKVMRQRGRYKKEKKEEE